MHTSDVGYYTELVRRRSVL